MLFLTGCTTYFLKKNTANQAKTVQEILADEILYNLVIAKEFNEGHTYNGIPSFVTLVTGQSTVQDSLTPQLSVSVPAVNAMSGVNGNPSYTPQVSGTHQIQDNWSFSPVVDPNVLTRLFWLYQSQFGYISNMVSIVIRTNPPSLDQNGRPFLVYSPVPDTNHPGYVLMTNNQPVFTAVAPVYGLPPTVDQIPGARNKSGNPINPWFTFEPPKDCTTNCYKWSYFGRTVYITNRVGFFNFAMLALGGTNAVTASSSSSSPFLQLYQGGLIQLRTLNQ
jgi:hypothetical protein